MTISRNRFRFALAAAGLALAGPAAACIPALEGTRLESPRFVVAFKPEPISVAKHFANETLITYPVPDEMLDLVRRVLAPDGVTPAPAGVSFQYPTKQPGSRPAKTRSTSASDGGG